MQCDDGTVNIDKTPYMKAQVPAAPIFMGWMLTSKLAILWCSHACSATATCAAAVHCTSYEL